MAPDGDRDRDLGVVVSTTMLEHPYVRSVELVGSRAAGKPMPLSDWDFAVRVDDFPAVDHDLPDLVSRLEPLAQQWDRLTSPACYMLMLRGPVKVDLIFPDVPRAFDPPWGVSADTLEGIDRHFWDWILWLASKRQRGHDERVREELVKMRDHLLGPMGAERAPRSIEEAIDRYRDARDRLEGETGVAVPRRLELEVLPAIPRG
jgi:hypothetical protein